MTATERRSLAVLAVALIAGAGLAMAETSSWTSSVDGPAAPIERKPGTSKPGAVKIIKTVPQADGPGQMAPPEKASTHAKQAAPGEDAAYEAFDQGRYVTALQLAVKAAERGEPTAHTLVGRIYADGLGTAKNAPLAAQWYARGAELGDPEAMFAYGLVLAEGKGVDKDRTEAARFLEAAAARKHALANYNLALMFLSGDGKPENPHRALAHMRYAAEQGVVTAQYDLGTMYATGQGTDANAFEAARWIGKAAAAGHVEAQIDYAVILFRGHGVEPDAQQGRGVLPPRGGKGRGHGAEPAGALLCARRRRGEGPRRGGEVELHRQGRRHRRPGAGEAARPALAQRQGQGAGGGRAMAG